MEASQSQASIGGTHASYRKTDVHALPHIRSKISPLLDDNARPGGTIKLLATMQFLGRSDLQTLLTDARLCSGSSPSQDRARSRAVLSASQLQSTNIAVILAEEGSYPVYRFIASRKSATNASSPSPLYSQHSLSICCIPSHSQSTVPVFRTQSRGLRVQTTPPTMRRFLDSTRSNKRSLQSSAEREERKNNTISIHTALDNCFRGYSVFPPIPEDELQLFQVVFIRSSSDQRHRSPRKTPCNLKTLIETADRYLEPKLLAPPHLKTACNADNWKGISASFQVEFEHLSSKSPSTTYEADRPMMTNVSKSSLHRAGVSASLLGLNFHAQAGREREAHNSKDVMIEGVKSHGYVGGGTLKTLLWEHIRILFPLIIGDNQDAFAGPLGKKRLLGIVTKRFLANVNVSWLDFRSAADGVSASTPIPETALGGGRESVRGSASSGYYSGVCSLNLIVLPVEKIGKRLFRVFEPIDVCDVEDEESAGSEDDAEDAPGGDAGGDSAGNSGGSSGGNPGDSSGGGSGASRGPEGMFSDSLGWHGGSGSIDLDSKDINTRAYGPSSYMDFEPGSPSDSSISSSDGAVQTPVSLADDLGCGGDSPQSCTLSFVDIDVDEYGSDCIPDFQLALIESYRANGAELRGGDSTLGKHVVALLRSVLNKFRPTSFGIALKELAECHSDGTGMKKDPRKAEDLMKFLRIFEGKVHREKFLEDLKTRFDEFRGSAEPEVRPFEIAAASVDDDLVMTDAHPEIRTLPISQGHMIFPGDAQAATIAAHGGRGEPESRSQGADDEELAGGLGISAGSAVPSSETSQAPRGKYTSPKTPHCPENVIVKRIPPTPILKDVPSGQSSKPPPQLALPPIHCRMEAAPLSISSHSEQP